jgi:hypothetical protein
MNAARLALARIIHEGSVNNPGLPDQWPIPLAAGRRMGVGVNCAVSRCATVV